jgi:hypothetical protein
LWHFLTSFVLSFASSRLYSISLGQILSSHLWNPKELQKVLFCNEIVVFHLWILVSRSYFSIRCRRKVYFRLNRNNLIYLDMLGQNSKFLEGSEVRGSASTDFRISESSWGPMVMPPATTRWGTKLTCTMEQPWPSQKGRPFKFNFLILGQVINIDAHRVEGGKVWKI